MEGSVQFSSLTPSTAAGQGRRHVFTCVRAGFGVVWCSWASRVAGGWQGAAAGGAGAWPWGGSCTQRPRQARQQVALTEVLGLVVKARAGAKGEGEALASESGGHLATCSTAEGGMGGVPGGRLRAGQKPGGVNAGGRPEQASQGLLPTATKPTVPGAPDCHHPSSARTPHPPPLPGVKLPGVQNWFSYVLTCCSSILDSVA